MWDALVIAYEHRNESEWAEGRFAGAMTVYLIATGMREEQVRGMLLARSVSAAKS